MTQPGTRVLSERGCPRLDILDLARALDVPDAPDHWDADVFDRIWQVDYGLDHASLTRVHQRLLFGDTD